MSVLGLTARQFCSKLNSENNYLILVIDHEEANSPGKGKRAQRHKEITKAENGQTD